MTSNNAATFDGTTTAMVVQARTISGNVNLYPQTRTVPAQAPARLAVFINRSRDLTALQELMAQPGRAHVPKVAVLAGAAGIGKSALAIELIHHLHDRFDDGQLVLELRHSVAAPDSAADPLYEMLARLLRGLGVAAQDVPASVDEAAASWRTLTRGRALALLIDDVTDWTLVHALLPPSHRALVLVTTRAQPDPVAGLDGAHIRPLEPLSPDDSHALVTRILGERAGDEPGPAHRLVELTGGFPGALVLAALTARADQNRSLRDYVATLTAVSRSQGGDVPNPLAVIHRRLSPESKRLYELLGWWPGPTVEAGVIAALLNCAPAAVESATAELQTAGVLDEAGTARWSRAVAVEEHQQRMAAGLPVHELDDALRRAAEYLWTWCGAVDRLVTPHRTQLADHVPDYRLGVVPAFSRDAALEWMSAELETIHLIARAVHKRGHHQLAWEILDRLWPVLLVHKRYELAEAINTTFLDAARSTDEPALIAASAKRLGMALRAAGRFEQALENLILARELWTAAGNLHKATQAAVQIALVDLAAGRADDAAAQLRVHLATHEDFGSSDRTVALVRLDLAVALLATNSASNAQEALMHAELAWHALTELDDPYNAARALAQVGRAYAACAWGETKLSLLTTAKSQLTHAIANLGKLGSRYEVAQAQMALAPVEAQLGQLLAKALLTEAGETLRGLGSPLAGVAFTQRSALPTPGTRL